MVGTRSQIYPLKQISATQASKKKQKLKLKERNVYEYAEKENNASCANEIKNVVESVIAGFSAEEQKCMSTLDVLGDGNCLLRAISQGYHGDENRYMNIREMAAKELKENWSYYKTDRGLNDFELTESLKQLSNDRQWYGTEELEFIANGIKAVIMLYIKTRQLNDGMNIKINAQRLDIPSRHVWNKDIVYPIICITWDKVETSVHFQSVQLNGVRPRLLSFDNVVPIKKRANMDEFCAFLQSQYLPILEYNAYDDNIQRGIAKFLKDYIPTPGVDPADFVQMAVNYMVQERDFNGSRRVMVHSSNLNKVDEVWNKCNESQSMSDANLLLDISKQADGQKKSEQTGAGDQNVKESGAQQEVASIVSVVDPLKQLVKSEGHEHIEESIISTQDVTSHHESAQEYTTVVQNARLKANNDEEPAGAITGIYDDGSEFFQASDSEVSMPKSQSRFSVDSETLTVTTVEKFSRKRKKIASSQVLPSSSGITFKVNKSQIAELLMQQLKEQFDIEDFLTMLINASVGKGAINKQSLKKKSRKREQPPDSVDSDFESCSQSSNSISTDSSSISGDSTSDDALIQGVSLRSISKISSTRLMPRIQSKPTQHYLITIPVLVDLLSRRMEATRMPSMEKLNNSV
ncbi:hypothetical protein MIR68_000505 [Amoeboaphelidium protococcarum]|nr:hypothetical protein MIR68_000505 [Amoeboaphelidium protococcarum]